MSYFGRSAVGLGADGTAGSTGTTGLGSGAAAFSTDVGRSGAGVETASGGAGVRGVSWAGRTRVAKYTPKPIATTSNTIANTLRPVRIVSVFILLGSP